MNRHVNAIAGRLSLRHGGRHGGRDVMGDGHENMIFSLLTPSMCSRS